MKVDPRTARNLEQVHPDLVMLMRTFEPPWPIVIIDGVRTLEEQEKLFEDGASATLNSRHLLKRAAKLGREYAHAVDFAVFPDGIDKPVSWEWQYYAAVGAALKAHARRMNIDIKWGGDWPQRDGGHIQLSWAGYPIATQVAGVNDPVNKPTKTPEASTTIAAAGGVSAVALAQHAMSILDGLETTWAEYAALAVILIFAGYIVKERILKIDEGGT